jgi:hypothetical protein
MRSLALARLAPLARLDAMHAAGAQVVRITAASEGAADAPLQASPALQPRPGEYDETLLASLDLVLLELRNRRMRAVLVLNNMWTWSGGFATYVAPCARVRSADATMHMRRRWALLRLPVPESEIRRAPAGTWCGRAGRRGVISPSRRRICKATGSSCLRTCGRTT